MSTSQFVPDVKPLTPAVLERAIYRGQLKDEPHLYYEYDSNQWELVVLRAAAVQEGRE